MEENQIVIYQTEDGQTQIDVRLENETVWLTQAQMAELFQTDRTSIVRHINNIYKVEELDRNSTCAKTAQVQKEGKRVVRRNIPYFNLDMIISVGYRVNSKSLPLIDSTQPSLTMRTVRAIASARSCTMAPGCLRGTSVPSSM